MEKQKSWVLRPVSWVCTLAMVLGIQFVGWLICYVGGILTSWLSGLSTIVIVLLVLAFGSVFCGAVFYAVAFLPLLLVETSDKIYPSHHALRYYVLGIYEIASCAFLIYMAIIGAVRGGSMFWFYARFLYIILASVMMIVYGRNAAKSRT
ncbi:MAG TPA: hypothetical protein DDY87_03560 [Clostridiales bacterium]|nr:hypothetical protein [Clostridiales bacterium]